MTSPAAPAASAGQTLLRRLARVAFALALVIVAVLLLAPSEALPETGIWDKLEHGGVFAGLAFLGCLAFPQRHWGWPMALALIAFGGVCEALQMFIPGREAALSDALANALGVIVACGIWRLLRRPTPRAGGTY